MVMARGRGTPCRLYAATQLSGRAESMLFCPFCKEGFDDAERCPHHDVELITLRALGQLSAARVPDDQRLPFWSPKLGRGMLLTAALGTLLAFFCPFGQLLGEVTVSNTLFTLARGRAVRLWVVPLAALAMLLMLFRRRTPAAMRGARLSALFVSVLPSAVVLITWLGASKAADVMATSSGGEIKFRLGLGSWFVFVSSALALIGSPRLGVQPKTRVR